MPQKIEIINPLNYSDWDSILLLIKESTFFHSQSWCNVLAQSYGYKPKYFVGFDNEGISTLIPFMEIKTLFSPKRGISLPFTDYCQPIVSMETTFNEIFDAVSNYARNAGWKFVEFRGGNSHFKDVIPSSLFYEHKLFLNKDENKILDSFRSSTKRNIKKALKEDIKVNIDNSFDSLRKFYRLNCITRKSHGLPPQPFAFFKKVFAYVISKKNGFIALAYYHDRVIAGAVYFHFGDKAIYKYGASERQFQQLRANNLIMWEAIKWYAQREYSEFSFGKTNPENHGLLQFKRGWGTQEISLYYYKYDFNDNRFIEDPVRKEKYYEILKKLPVPCLRMAGSLMYKHVG